MRSHVIWRRVHLGGLVMVQGRAYRTNARPGSELEVRVGATRRVTAYTLHGRRVRLMTARRDRFGFVVDQRRRREGDRLGRQWAADSSPDASRARKTPQAKARTTPGGKRRRPHHAHAQRDGQLMMISPRNAAALARLARGPVPA
jgi:hypothetical protein